MSKSENWEVKLVSSNDGTSVSQTQQIWNDNCVDGWEPFAVHASANGNRPFFVMHFKRRVK